VAGPAVSPIQFNLAHSDELALVAVSREPVGVDLERIDPGRCKDDRIVEQFFSPKEQREFREIPADRRSEAFFAGWTRKEAYLKATGCGLGTPLDTFSVTLDPDSTLLEVETDEPADNGRWSIQAFSPEPGYLAAVASEMTPLRVVLGRWPSGP